MVDYARLKDPISEIVKADGRYPFGAYAAVFEGLERGLAAEHVKRHLTPEELVQGIAKYVATEFGFLARTVVEDLRLRIKADLRTVVETLSQCKLLVLSPANLEGIAALPRPFLVYVDDAVENDLLANSPRIEPTRFHL
ncbi:hypothetical protein J4419_01860 [Candidatus Woesearchaeota archaeon]|nr:hypothetical protein [Candidatus Woesearchaeota archaeon]